MFFIFFQVSDESMHVGRQLMATAGNETVTYNGTFYQNQTVLIYLQYVNVTIKPKMTKDGKAQPTQKYNFDFKSPSVTIERLSITANGTETKNDTVYNGLR